MSQITAIKDGDGVGAVIMVEGKPTAFVMGLFSKPSWYAEKKDFSFGFVNLEKGLYIEGCYAGGHTGFGRDIRDMKPITLTNGHWTVERYSDEVLTLESTDLDIIRQAGIDADTQEEKEEKESIAKQEAKVAAINKLPSVFKSNIPLPVELEYIRSEATFNPKYSRQVQWYMECKLNGKSFSPLNYQSHGKVFVKQFARDMVNWFQGENAHRVKSEIIRDIIAEYRNIKTKIENAQ